MVLGEAVHAGQRVRVEPIQGNEVDTRDVKLSVLRRGADIEEGKGFTVLPSLVELLRRDRFHAFYISLLSDTSMDPSGNFERMYCGTLIITGEPHEAAHCFWLSFMTIHRYKIKIVPWLNSIAML